MHFLIKWKKNPRLLLTIGMLFYFISALTLQNYSLIKENQRIFEKDNLDSPTLKISDYWNNITFIHINNDNWSSTDVDWIQNRTGTWDDPHIIENITINGGGSGSCIIIENSNEFFIIRNCTFYNSGPLINQQTFHFDAGIKLVNTSNGLIMNNNCSDTMVGIIVVISFNITISRNAVDNNKWGISSLASNNITISENNLKDNGAGVIEAVSNNINITNNTINNNSLGILLNSGYNNTLSRNNMTECGLFLTGNQEEISSHVVDDTNLVNGNPFYYLINENGLGKENFTNPGQIILINCSDSLISDLSISHATCGIFLYYCDNNTIQNNNISHCSAVGIGLWFCSDFTVSKNLMIHCGFFMTGTPESFYSHNFTSNLVNEKAVYYYINENGLGKDNFTNPGQIFLINCSDSLVSNLNVSHATMGIALVFCTNDIIFNITASHNLYGIMMGFSYDNTISENILNNNANSGIYFSGTLNNTIINNTINENGIGIEFPNDCYNNTIAENSINNNNQGVLMGTYGICENNILFGNSIKNNKNEGIFLRNCNNNTFSGNIIRDNGWCGIICNENCDINRFYGNYFMGNGIHAIEDPSNTNYWNSSVVGNFWDDYTSKDADNDGIGDTPHYFMDSVDYLPIWESLIPNIIINFPSDNAIFRSAAPNFEVLIKDETIVLLKDIVHIDTMWYTLDGGETNYTFITNGTINQEAWDVLPEGLVTLRFHANDTLGNLGSETVIIFKDTMAPDIPSQPSIPGYNIFIIIGTFLVFIAIVCIYRIKKRSTL